MHRSPPSLFLSLTIKEEGLCSRFVIQFFSLGEILFYSFYTCFPPLSNPWNQLLHLAQGTKNLHGSSREGKSNIFSLHSRLLFCKPRSNGMCNFGGCFLLFFDSFCSALYQFHLVKSEVARALVPKEFRLVEAFGYTLGGFFLASYEDSPAGVFDELVVIAGLVWNPPTSCAWASRVLVSSNEACVHGRKDVGLPSHVARFSKNGFAVEMVKQRGSKANGFLRRIGVAASERSPPCIHTATEVTQLSDIFSINLINTVPQQSSNKWMGPSVKVSLPSFSGRTKDNPCLLKYSCQMACRVRVVKPLRVTAPYAGAVDKETEQLDQTTKKLKTDASDLSLLVMLSKPILALEFNCMNMNVEAPFVIAE